MNLQKQLRIGRSIRRLTFTLGAIVFLAFGALGQKSSISGVVISEQGDPLVGVTVSVKNATTGTFTNERGYYSLSVAPGDVLVFSHVSYKAQEHEVGDRTVLDIILREEIKSLQEVVVTGYSSIKRSDLVTAHTSLDAKDVNRTVNQTIEQALQGRVAGVQVTQNSGQPGGGISVNIRGISTINGNTQPLYVVDGVQMQVDQIEFGAQSGTNPLAGLNPSDIESIEVLTGPVATSLYGSRATNGVIVIKTKSGRIGEMRVKYDYTISQQTKPVFLDMMNLHEYAAMAKEYYALEGGVLPGVFEDPSLLGEGTNWQDELFNNATMQKHNFSLSGGTEK
ncbi:MAG: TonB-dependent receptor plug domain-containing protein, partial [Bacteroidetes bacterium]|nr:TonB-dependent receptor plug domain-containing protein [Bacteroidota bacterium]